MTSSYTTWKDTDSSILRLSAAFAQQEVFFNPNSIFFSWSTFFLYLNQSELQNIMSTVLNRKGEEVMGCVILNLSAACARNYHFLGRTIIFEGRGSFLTILKCVQIKNKPICAKQNISSLSTVEYLNLSRIC